MHEELIEKLRCCVDQIRCGDCRYVKDCDGDRMLMSQAADAIEEMSAKYQMALSDLVRQAKPHEQTIDAEQLKKALDYYIRLKPTIIPASEDGE